jgi:cytoskeleton protein RodZ
MTKVGSMTENNTPLTPAASTAGSLLRAAREQQGIHIAVLAAAIKISTRKLDALEGDRYGELPDPAFTRALAQTVARALKLDPQPVLALLPPAAAASGLESVGEGLNTPFRDRSSPNELSALLPRAPLVWAGLALLAAAALLLYWPYRSTTPAASSPAPVTQNPPPRGFDSPPAVATPTNIVPQGATPTTPSQADVAAAAVPSAAASVPTIDPAAPLPAAAAGASGASVSVIEPVWLEVIDGTGAVVFMRTIQPGEVVNFDQPLPLRLKLGNASAAKVSFRGEAVDLVPLTRGSVARVVLK